VSTVGLTAGTLPWFAAHELRLAWRDFLSMMTAGRPGRGRMVTVALVVFAVFMHVIAWSMVMNHGEAGPDLPTLVAVTGCLGLAMSLMLSQAMEAVTRGFYARADLDLILSSPVAARRVFTVRIAAIAFSTLVLAVLVASPFINVLTFLGGARWLGAYAVVAAVGLVAASMAVALTVALFRSIGPKRTRLVAQIVAAVIGAGFVIGLQVVAIMSSGTLSRLDILQSQAVLTHAPAVDSLLWWPARAVLGDGFALAGVSVVSVVTLGLTIAVFAGKFADHAAAAAGVDFAPSRRRRDIAFRVRSPKRALRRKEWTLLWRDPWLMSQTLMQLLYLAPPAVLLWRSFEDGADGLVLLVPILVMAAGQLAGGLAWLAISGEDAPDLVATAPVPAAWILRAKVEAVMIAIAAIFAPFMAVLAVLAPYYALCAGLGILISTASATAIQLWFRVQAKRSHFRRRQTSSRIATFAEAFSSILWAATAVLAAAGTVAAIMTAVLALLILAGCSWLRPSVS
jgi:ABC-2 type transport system permease protein